ncbi:MAG: hypothetical protein IJG16_03750 [Clostridia bacterium]|nr:hypothetical protein [Clostridia bacterium]
MSVSGKNAAGASWRFYLSSTEVNTWKNDNPTYPYSFTGNVTISSDGQLKIAPYKKDSTLYNSVDIDYIIVRDPNTVTDYTVKAVTPEGAAIAEITTGITKTASAVSGLPEVVQDSNNKYYRISDNLVAENSHTKNITKKLTAGDTINVEYTLDENIVYFVEGESFTSKKNFSDTIIAKSTMSGGNSAASTADYTLNGGAAFDAGNYNFEAYVVNRPNKRIGVQAVDISYANVVSKAADTFPEGFTDSTSYGMYTTNFTLSKSTKLILKQTNKETAEFDYIIISKVTE